MINQPGIIVKAKNELVEIMKDKRVVTLIKLIADETPLGKVTKPLRQGYRALIGVSLDIENYCTLRLFFDLVDLNWSQTTKLT
ncbi:hypothetical protein ACSRYY_004848 [Escherichia coli]|uniref:hypothetical protein n=2 Tax=Enterobacterales TaxID=91347 RepID=UPI00156C1AD3|nr:hypothetical protein [Escherichia coli]EFG7838807.1 hypothetical protein [Escherichia coli]EGI4641222.1 hypothetical protein [Escherichia coli]EHT1776127.1 hypothetical protein [Escherichia coli]EIN1269091.1 hypothetical protein [Escherichia coli]EIU9975671.1 hypothetical protein [Escherichia coli]